MWNRNLLYCATKKTENNTRPIFISKDAKKKFLDNIERLKSQCQNVVHDESNRSISATCPQENGKSFPRTIIYYDNCRDKKIVNQNGQLKCEPQCGCESVRVRGNTYQQNVSSWCASECAQVKKIYSGIETTTEPKYRSGFEGTNSSSIYQETTCKCCDSDFSPLPGASCFIPFAANNNMGATCDDLKCNSNFVWEKFRGRIDPFDKTLF